MRAFILSLTIYSRKIVREDSNPPLHPYTPLACRDVGMTGRHSKENEKKIFWKKRGSIVNGMNPEFSANKKSPHKMRAFICCGLDGTRTRDLRRDRAAF